METPSDRSLSRSVSRLAYDLDQLRLSSVTAADDDIQSIIYQVAKETAEAHYETTDEYEMRRLVFRNCQKVSSENNFRNLLMNNSNLVNCRATNLDNLAPDGQTPLHAASVFNNVLAVTILLNDFNANSWSRDLRGRTPLHVAAENGSTEVCKLLREAMLLQRNVDPIGERAPVDLAGATPLGSACHRKKGVVPEIASILFSPGDRTILPKTPVSKRIGKSPWKSIKNYHDEILFAHSEAQGWSKRMEDRLVTSSPVPGQGSWNLFAVFDGHGGSFCSEYLSQNFPAIVSKVAGEVLNRRSKSIFDGSLSVEYEETAKELESVLMIACQRAEDALKEHPRLKVTKTGGKYRCMDNSGSTGVICLITESFVIVGNVGDSRAFLSSTINNQHNQTVYEIKNMSIDHKFSLIDEQRRALNAGARIQQNIRLSNEDIETIEVTIDNMTTLSQKGSFEVFSCNKESRLRMSRSFGDFMFKQNENLSDNQQAVIAVPEIMTHRRSSRDTFVVLACDGVWDVMTNQDVNDFFIQILNLSDPSLSMLTSEDLAEACDKLLEEVIRRGSQDNLTVILVFFANNQITSNLNTETFHDQMSPVEASLLQSIDASTNSSPYVVNPSLPGCQMIFSESSEASDACDVPLQNEAVSRQLSFEA